MKILAISDLHTTGLKGLDRYVRDCALVLVAGDFTEHGRTRGVEQSVRWVQDVFRPWCASFPDVRFCVVPGDHDLFAERRADEIRWPANVIYLDPLASDPVARTCEVSGLKIYGVARTPYLKGGAFESSPEALARAFAEIPEGLDILISHAPPLIDGYNLDVDGRRRRHRGSVELAEAICRARPRLVVCGHVHGGDHRRAVLGNGTVVVNVSRVLDDRGTVTTRPRVIDVEERDGTRVFHLEEDEGSAAETAPAASVGAAKQIERAEKILFKAVRSINKHVEKGDFAPNLHYIDQLDDVRTTLAPFVAEHPLVGVYLARLDEVAASRAQGWRLRVGDVPRFGEGRASARPQTGRARSPSAPQREDS